MKSSHFYINKYIIINVLILSILTLNIRGTQAQVFDQDQPSFKTKWRQINNSQFQLIYPQEFEKSASLLAQRIETMMRNASNDLQIKPRKISIIVQGNHVEQNGFAQLAPRKVELFSSPGPASDNTVWLNNLLQHELRHVAQFDKLTGKIKGPFFEQLALALYGIHLPAWYFEGDAVAIETQFSNGGRGRSSSWMMPLKVNLLAGKNYDFNKNVLGSFKDITPSYYLTGYLMNSYLSNHFGEEVKERILERMRRHLLRPFNFNLALKKETDLYSSQLYKHSISAWKEELEAQSPEPETALLFPQDDRYYSNYLLPQTNSSGRIYSLIESPQRTPQIAEISEQKPKTLIKLGFQLRPYFNVNNNHIVWDEIRRDSRFGKQTYNILRIYDIRSKKTWNLSKNSRLYSPVIDSNSENIYAINIDQDNVSSLVKINLRSKEQVELFHLADGSQLQQPAISPDNQKILLICISEKGNNLIEYDLQNGEWTALLPWSNQEFERPNYLQEDVIFRAQVGQTDQLVQLDRKQNQLFQLGHSAIGNSSASSYKPSEILYNNYRFNGYIKSPKRLDPKI